MPNQLTANGLQTATETELNTQFVGQMQAAYGNDINTDSDTPDGQWIGNIIQECLDLEDLLTQIYNSFNPDTAFGVILDQRVSINGIQRQAGTYTTTNISIVTSQACTLYGLNQVANPVYTVSDAAGNQWQLQTTTAISGSGTTVAAFQSASPGAVLTVPNTITIPVSIVLGVTSVNNPTTYSALGVNEETDAALKVRRSQSLQNASQGYYNALYGLLANVPGVTGVYIHENDSSVTDSNGVPPHSIWVILSGSGASASIGQAIYGKRNAGCGMKGTHSYTITQADGTAFQVYWDVVSTQSFYAKFTATSLNGTVSPLVAQIIAQLPALFVPGVAAEVNINQLATFVQQIDPNCLVTGAGFSFTIGGSYTNTLSPSSLTQQLLLTSATVYILPILLTPSTITVPRTQTQQFTAVGGSQSYTYSLSVNNSGGSINGSSGLYTAGSSTGTDTVLVTDTQSNTQTATVTVI